MNKFAKVLVLLAIAIPVASFGILGCGGSVNTDVDTSGLDAAEMEAINEADATPSEAMPGEKVSAPEGEPTTSSDPSDPS